MLVLIHFGIKDVSNVTKHLDSASHINLHLRKSQFSHVLNKHSSNFADIRTELELNPSASNVNTKSDPNRSQVLQNCIIVSAINVLSNNVNFRFK